MIINTVTVVRIVDKVRRARIVPPHWRFLLGLVLVSVAHIISAIMMIHPDANPSPKLEYTEQKCFTESYQYQDRMLLTNVPMLHSDELWVVLPLPDCEANFFVCQSGL